MCQNCFEEHEKRDNILDLKIDSICKKHYSKYIIYCPICKENKCSYCSMDHDENLEKYEILLNKKMLKKSKLDEFKKNIIKIINDKEKIEKEIDSFLKELEKTIEFINNLKIKYLNCLNMKLELAKLVLYNYEKKLNDFDINYSIINNLENQMKFKLFELELNKNDSLDKKIERITQYLNESINSQFNFENEEENEFKKTEIIFGNNITSVDFKYKADIKYDIIGFLDFNKYLFAFYSSNSIYFVTKNKYETRFEIKEFEINGIKICKKIDDRRLLVYSNNKILFIDILDNSDYKINKRIILSCDIYDFNSNLDLLCLNYNGDKYSYYNVSYYTIKLLLFPDYNNQKFSIRQKINYIKNGKLQFVGANTFFHFSNDIMEKFILKNNGYSLENNVKINIDSNNSSIID